MPRSTKTADTVRADILRICRQRYVPLEELAAALGRSTHTVRAYYIYPLVREGVLEPLHPPGKRAAQAYRVARKEG